MFCLFSHNLIRENFGKIKLGVLFNLGKIIYGKIRANLISGFACFA